MTRYVESFEGVTPSANAPDAGKGFLSVGYQAVYRFGSGLEYVAPVPNTPAQDFRSALGDFNRGAASWDLFLNGVVSANDVPDGKAYMGAFNDAGEGGDHLEYHLTQPAYSFSAAVDAGQTNAVAHIHIEAYDSGGKLIAGTTLQGVPVHQWSQNVFFFVSDKPIAYVDISGPHVVVDKLTWNTDPARTITGTMHDDRVDARHTVAGEHLPTAKVELLLGRGGDDRLSALAGSDTLNGGSGNDHLYGGRGNDILTGGPGHDVLFGGHGQDSFLFKSSLTEPFDRIADFRPGTDTILLSKSIFGGLELGALAPENFSASGSGADPHARVVYEADTGKLLYDADGNGPDDPTQFARLAKHLALSAGDFWVA